MFVHRLAIGPVNSNCYVVENGKDALIIDPAEDYIPVVNLIQKKNLKVQALLCTHLHFDHVSGARQLIDLMNLPVYLGKEDIAMKDTLLTGAVLFGMPMVDTFEPTAIAEGKYAFGSLECRVISTPGHSPGGLCFYFEAENPYLISGDTLFYHAIGRSDFDGGNYETLIRSIREKLFILPDNTIVCPGHGSESTILEEKLNNPFLK